MIVLDASVLIALLDTTDAHHDRAFGLLSRYIEEPLAVGPVTLAEVLVGPTRTGAIERVASVLRRLELTTVPMDAAAPRRLAALRTSTGLKFPDCCVLLAAEQAGAVLATFDDRLATAAQGQGIEVRAG